MTSMSRIEAEHRDRTLRAFFAGKSWDHNDEFRLKRHFVLNSHALLPEFPYVVDDEWEVDPGHSNGGRGDLLFTDGDGAFAVVEVKYIDLVASGKTARRKRTLNRSSVAGQAPTYARVIASRYGGEVRGFKYTNEDPEPQLVVIVDPKPLAGALSTEASAQPR